jgi:FAD/FMN-containing dehydrogenase
VTQHDEPSATHRPTRRAVLASTLAAAASASIADPARAEPEIVLNDASGLDPTPVARHVVLGPDSEAKNLAKLRAELRAAEAAGRPVAMGVARHSMGGQSLAREGTALTFDMPVCIPDRASNTYRAQAGTRWRDVIKTLDPLGFSPVVMQSNNDFGVASAFSVNAHGWPVAHGPFGSTVRSLRMMLADGSVVTCSLNENAELFRHAMGGYGLFGIILDLDVEMVPNAALLPRFEPLPAGAFAPRFLATCNDPAVNMAYGRLDVSRRHFLEQALLVSYRPAPAVPGPLPSAHAGGVVSVLSREIYRAEIGSDFAKRFRWFMETTVGPRLEAGCVTRNSLLDEPVAALAGHDPVRTDILHEYFLPAERLADFLAACRDVITNSRQGLLNVTMRYVAADRQSVLAYAPAPRISAVMSFSQAKTAEAEADMQQMTRNLIERVLAVGGSFYLPYRLHARREQVARAYPAVAGFVAVKRQYDPSLRFQNALWTKWIA